MDCSYGEVHTNQWNTNHLAIIAAIENDVEVDDREAHGEHLVPRQKIQEAVEPEWQFLFSTGPPKSGFGASWTNFSALGSVKKTAVILILNSRISFIFWPKKFEHKTRLREACRFGGSMHTGTQQTSLRLLILDSVNLNVHLCPSKAHGEVLTMVHGPANAKTDLDNRHY